MIPNTRVGLILPANNTVVEPEFYSMHLTNVTFHSARLPVSSQNEKGLLAMLTGLQDAASLLTTCRPDVIAFCCFSSSFIKGVDWNKRLGKRIEKASGVPSVTAATAVVQAMKDLRLKRIVCLSAYDETLGSVMTDFLSKNGFKVANSVELGLALDEIGDYATEELFTKAKKAFKKDAEGLLIGSTDLQSMPIIERLEQELGKPVVTVNQALAKYSLLAAGLRVRIPGCGRLLRE